MAMGFMYYTKKWHQLSAEHKILISDNDDAFISRSDVVMAYNDYYSGHGDYIRAFLLTMVWGFGNTGYGTYRTNSFLSDTENRLIIKDSIEAVRSNNLKFAFDNLKKIKGLGVSYITKVLYFATRGAGIQDYALIFDIRVAHSLVRLSASNDVYEIVKVSPTTKFEDYMKYNTLLHRLAKQYEVEAEAIELFLFKQEFL